MRRAVRRPCAPPPLGRRFGPLAAVATAPPTAAARRARDVGAESEGDGGGLFRAAVTFRQCGFAVELSTATGKTAEEAEREACEAALKLDVEFINPAKYSAQKTYDRPAPSAVSLKAMLDALRQKCTAAGRMMKFSIKDCRDEGYACIAYMRDDWAIPPTPVVVCRTSSQSANDALNQAFYAVHQAFQAEDQQEEVVKEDFYEVSRWLGIRGKSCRETCRTAPSSDQKNTVYTVNVEVEDAFGNMYSLYGKAPQFPQIAYNYVARMLQSREGEPLRSLLSRLRWQVEGLAYRSLGLDYVATRGYEDIITYQEHTAKDGIVGSVMFNGVQIGESRGEGTYRVELMTYVEALKYFLTRVPTKDIVRHFPNGFTSLEGLQAEVDALLELPILSIHKGKWNPYAVLGTLTNAVLGSFYQTRYTEDTVAETTTAVLTVNDGLSSDRVLQTASSRGDRGDAWRRSCEAAISNNFPEQQAMLSSRVDYGINPDKIARLRALPRNKRVAHMSSAQSMIMAFSEEDFGWRDMRFVSRLNMGAGNSRWSCEIHATVDREPKVILTSPPLATAKEAKKRALLMLASKNWPEELKSYMSLKRGDIAPQDIEVLQQKYNSAYPLVEQICRIIETQNPELAPVGWTAELLQYTRRSSDTHDAMSMPRFSPVFRVAIVSKATRTLHEENSVKEPRSLAEITLRALRSAGELLGVQTEVERLLREYEADMPDGGVKKCRDYAKWMMTSFFGSAISVSYTSKNNLWVATAVLGLNGGATLIPFARATHRTKREAGDKVLEGAARDGFRYLLLHHSKQTEMAEFAEVILKMQGPSTMDHALGGPGEIEAPPEHKPLKSPAADTDYPTGTEDVSPYALLKSCVRLYDAAYVVSRRVVSKSEDGVSVVLRKTPLRVTAPSADLGEGWGVGIIEATHNAAVAALESHYPEEFSKRIERNASYAVFDPRIHASAGESTIDL